LTYGLLDFEAKLLGVLHAWKQGRGLGVDGGYRIFLDFILLVEGTELNLTLLESVPFTADVLFFCSRDICFSRAQGSHLFWPYSSEDPSEGAALLT